MNAFLGCCALLLMTFGLFPGLLLTGHVNEEERTPRGGGDTTHTTMTDYDGGSETMGVMGRGRRKESEKRDSKKYSLLPVAHDTFLDSANLHQTNQKTLRTTYMKTNMRGKSFVSHRCGVDSPLDEENCTTTYTLGGDKEHEALRNFRFDLCVEGNNVSHWTLSHAQRFRGPWCLDNRQTASTRSLSPTVSPTTTGETVTPSEERLPTTTIQY